MNYEDVWPKIWRILYPPVIYLAVSAIVQFISYILISYIQFYRLKNEGETLTIGHSLEFMDTMQESVQKYATLITLISALLTLYILYKILKKENIKIIHYTKITNNYLYVVVLGLAASVGLSRLIGLLPINGLIDNYENVEKYIYSGTIGIQILAIAIVVPVLEEIIFRGLVYSRLKEITHTKVAATITSLMFGVYHMNLTQGIYAFCISFVLLFVYEKFNSLLAPIILHASANAFSIFLTYTGISNFFSKNIFVYILLMVIELAIAGAMIQLLRKVCRSDERQGY